MDRRTDIADPLCDFIGHDLKIGQRCPRRPSFRRILHFLVRETDPSTHFLNSLKSFKSIFRLYPWTDKYEIWQ